MDKIELIVMVCTDCKGVFAIESEYVKAYMDDEPPECYYCGSANTGTMVSGNEVS